MAKVKSLCF